MKYEFLIESLANAPLTEDPGGVGSARNSTGTIGIITIVNIAAEILPALSARAL